MSALTAVFDIAKTTGAFVVLGGAALTVANYTELRPVVVKEFRTVAEQVEQLSKSQLYIQFVWLQEKEKREPLTLEERVKMCQLNKILDLRLAIPGCG